MKHYMEEQMKQMKWYKRANVIVDLQFGSCGKGLLAGYLAKRTAPDTVVCAWGPNAGHTFIDADGSKMVVTMVPNGVVSPNLKRVMIGPGAVVNPELLQSELEMLAPHIGNAKVMIHEHAAVVTESHRFAESNYSFKIGSTMKGVGEAVISKIRRDPGQPAVARDVFQGTPLEGYVVCVEEYNMEMDKAELLQVEGSQGFSLGINNGYYPYTTSRECTVQQIMSDCAIPRSMFDLRVIGTARTYPIRVANRYDKDGNMIGTSGPCYPDQVELSWDEVGVPAELTTVTKLPRRVFTFSKEQVHQAIRMNGCDEVFLNFCNYLRDKPDELQHIISAIEQSAPVTMTGWGPTESDIFIRRAVGAAL